MRYTVLKVTMVYNLGQYVWGESIIHKLDPRVKIASVIGLSIIILKGVLIAEVFISVFLIALVPVSRLTFRHILRALRPIVVFLVLLFLLHLWFTDGTPIAPFPLWHLTMTYEGLYKGAHVAWDFVLLVFSASTLTMTTSPTELVGGIERLLRPLRVLGIPSYDVAIMISIALRFIPTLLAEIERIKEAQMARCANFGTGTLFQRIKATTSLVMPLVISSFRRADELAMAMEGRGYTRGPRTYMKELRLTRADYGAMMVMVIVTGLLYITSWCV